MTWCKTGVEFPDQLADADLSDSAYRTHHELITAIYRIEREDVTDLRMSRQQVRRVAYSADYEQAMKDLVAAGLWLDKGDHYELVHHADVVRQSLISQRKTRARDKKSQQAWRDRNRADVSDDVSDDVATDVSDDSDRQTDNHRRGNHSELEDAHARGDQGWPEVTSPPDSGDGDQAGCIGNGCPRQARRSCRTCWDHRDLEPAR